MKCWTPSLLLGHTEMKVTDKERFARQLSRHLKHEKTADRAGEEVEERVRQEADERTRQEPEEKAREEKEESTQQEADRAQNPQDRPHDRSVQECEFCKSRHDEISRLLEENRHLKHELDERKMTKQFLKDDNGKVNNYTGLPSYATFQILLFHIMPFLPQGRRKLTAFQMSLLTFGRLRLDLPIQHISHLFGVHQATVSATAR